MPMRTKTTRFNNALYIACFALLLLFFVAAGASTYMNFRNLQQSTLDASRTFNMVRQLNSLNEALVNAETGQRGFIITGDEKYLDTYSNGSVQAKNIIDDLAKLNLDEDDRATLDQLRGHIQNKFDELKSTIQVRREQGFEAAASLVSAGTGRQEMRAIQANLNSLDESFIAERNDRIALRDKAYANGVLSNFLVTLVGALLALIVAATTMAGLRRTQLQAWIQEGLVAFSALVHGNKSIHQVSESALTFINDYIGASVGALYALDRGTFVRSATYGLVEAGTIATTLSLGEGMTGEVLRSKKTTLIDNVPKNYLRFGSALGSAAPQIIYIIPALLQDAVNCVVELGFTARPQAHVIDFLERIREPLALAMRSAIYRADLQNFAEETQRQAEEIQSQNEELLASNDELEEQSNALRETQQELESQHELMAQRNQELARANALVNMKAREIEQASQYKSDFLANMSHELRTPLNSTLILSRLLSENGTGNLSDDQVTYAKTIHGASEDLLTLINDILDLSKIEAGHMEIVPERVEVKEITQSLESLFQPLAQQKNLGFALHLDPACPATLVADPMRLQQILKNLISNAIKFTSKGSVQLHLSCADEKTMRFDVKDTGIGIAPEKLSGIFDAFRQADSTTSRTYGGTGLGLSISRTLATLMGGRIGAASEPGKGSTFTLLLPFTYEGAASETDAPTLEYRTDNALSPALSLQAEGVDPQQQKRILIVEDDATQSADMLRALSRFDAVIDSVDTVGEGLKKLRTSPYDLVILDLLLGNSPGDAPGEALFKNALAQNVVLPPVIIFTAKSLDLKTESDLRQHAHAIIVKGPHANQRLSDEVASALRGHPRQHALSSDGQNPVHRARLEGKNVLLVEDDLRNIFALQSLLGPHKVNLNVAHNGREALEFLKQNANDNGAPVDLVLMDVMMPEMDGYAATQAIRNTNEWKGIPIIMLTAKVMKGDHERCLNAGANDYLPKPIDPEKLIALMRVWLGR